MRVVGQRRAKLEDQAKTVKPVGVRPRAAQEPRPVSGLADLQHRAGNRAVVNLLHNDGADSAQRVQRRLIPKVNDAFDEAIAHEPAYAAKKQNTDDEATTEEQESLARVHGRGHRSAKDSAEEKTLGNLVRAVVLSQFSDRLVALKTATDDTGQPLSNGAKARKRAVYNKKAEEFRQKQAPLVAAGMAAPETQAFLREHGFEAAIQPSKRAVAEARSGGARVDVRATFIGAEILGMRLRSHLFIVYTSKEGQQMYFRGGPDENGMTVADRGDYTPDTVDWDPSAPSVTVLEGAAAEQKLDALIEATDVIDGMQVPYQGVVAREFGGDNPNLAQKGLTFAAMAVSSEGENCNATAWTILTRAGIPAKKPGGHHPGWGFVLGSKTPGKENALPAPEQDTAKPTPYTLDEHRDATDKRGLVQVFWDRAMHEPQTKLAVGTKVTLLGDEARWMRKISYGGQVGYVRRTGKEAQLILMSRARPWMAANLSQAQLIALQDGTDPDLVDELEDDYGVPSDLSPSLAAQILQGSKNTAAVYVGARVDELGEAKARLLLSDPYELANLVRLSGASRKEVLAAIKAKLKEIDKKEEVRAALIAQIDDPLAPDIVLNEHPGYANLQAIAAKVGMPFQDVAEIIDECRPEARRGIFLHDLIASDPLIMGQLDNPDDYIVKDWAAKLGLPVAFIRNRLRDLGAVKKAEAEEARKKARAKKKANAKKKKAPPKQQAKAPELQPPDKQTGPVASGPTSQTLDIYDTFLGGGVVETISTPDKFKDLGPDDMDRGWELVVLEGRMLRAKQEEVAAFKRFHKI